MLNTISNYNKQLVVGVDVYKQFWETVTSISGQTGKASWKNNNDNDFIYLITFYSLLTSIYSFISFLKDTKDFLGKK